MLFVKDRRSVEGRFIFTKRDYFVYLFSFPKEGLFLVLQDETNSRFSSQATRNIANTTNTTTSTTTTMTTVRKQLSCCKPSPWQQWAGESEGSSSPQHGRPGGIFVSNSYYLSDPGMYAKHAEKIVQDDSLINLDDADEVRDRFCVFPQCSFHRARIFPPRKREK